MLAAASSVAPPGLPVTLYIIVAALAIIGPAGGYGIYKLIKGKGARDAQVDAMIDPQRVKRVDQTADAVLGTEVHPHGLMWIANQHSDALARIEAKVGANGLGSDNVGDTAKRLELGMALIAEKVGIDLAEMPIKPHLGGDDE